jgi:hypothetical protein
MPDDEINPACFNCLQAADLIDEVFTFNEEVIGIKADSPRTLTEAQIGWTRKAYAEEIVELDEAWHKRDIVGQVDATIDLLYFAIGTLKKLGLTREQAFLCFIAVHEANMTKKRGTVAGRGGEEDAAKPVDFVPPEQRISEIIGVPLVEGQQ